MRKWQRLGAICAVGVDDVLARRAPRPLVLDMFAGGGAIPLEALRLGCSSYAIDLNPVAYIIELCTLVYPQKYGKPDPTASGMSGLEFSLRSSQLADSRSRCQLAAVEVRCLPAIERHRRAEDRVGNVRER